MADLTLADLLRGRDMRTPTDRDLWWAMPPTLSGVENNRRPSPTTSTPISGFTAATLGFGWPGPAGAAGERADPALADDVLGMLPPVAAYRAGRDMIGPGMFEGRPGLAALGVGSAALAALPLTVAPRAGAALAMDRASRMSRARQMGYSERPFYRGDAGDLTEYPGSAFFSRDRATAAGHARRHQRTGTAEPREFRLNLDANFAFSGSLTREQRDRIVAAVAAENPRVGTQIGAMIDEGTPLGLIYHALERNTSDAGAVLRRAGFNSVDTGRDVLMLSGSGIRSADAAFDPALAGSRNIFHGLPFAGAATSPWWGDRD